MKRKLAILTLLSIALAVSPACRERGSRSAPKKKSTQQDSAKQASPKKVREDAWIEYRLMDGESVVQVPRAWISGKKEEDDLIAWITSDYGKGHTHRIYKMKTAEVQVDSGRDFAERMYRLLTDGEEIFSETDWLTGDSHGGKTDRRIAHHMSDIDEDGEKEEVWLVVESKDFGDFFYLQLCYHKAPLPREKLKTITKVMDTLKPKPAGAKGEP